MVPVAELYPKSAVIEIVYGVIKSSPVVDVVVVWLVVVLEFVVVFDVVVLLVVVLLVVVL